MAETASGKPVGDASWRLAWDRTRWIRGRALSELTVEESIIAAYLVGISDASNAIPRAQHG